MTATTRVAPVSEHIGARAFEELVRRRLSDEFDDVDLDAFSATLNLVRAANRLVNDLDQHVYRDFGISFAGFRVMFACWVVGATEPKELAVLANVTRSSISSVLNTLERDGLVVRRRASADRRVVTVNLTAKGDQLVKECFVRHHARERQWTDELSKANQVTLARLLRRVVEHHPEP